MKPPNLILLSLWLTFSGVLIGIKDTPADTPPAPKSAFYLGDHHRVRSVDRDLQPVEVTDQTKSVVPGETAAAVEYTRKTLTSLLIFAETPQNQAKPIRRRFPSQPPSKQATMAKELPASPFPMIVFGGFLLFLSFAVKRLATKP